MVALLSAFNFDAASRSALSSAVLVSIAAESFATWVDNSSILDADAVCTSSILLAKRSWCPDIMSWYVTSARACWSIRSFKSLFSFCSSSSLA